MAAATRARWCHLATAAVAAFAVVFQLVLVWQGNAVLDETDPPDLGTRLVRFCCYFTIQSNVLVAVTTARLAAGKDLDSRLWRVLRLNAVTGIAVTAVVHWFLLRPLLDLHGADFVADKLLHVVVPVLALAGWVAFGPRGRLDRRDLAPSAVFPAAYLLLTLVHGAVSEWYPYPFVDVGEHGYAVVLLNSLGIVLLLLGVSLGALWADRKLARASVT